MYISSFVCGAIATFLVEVLVVIVIAIVSINKRKRGD